MPQAPAGLRIEPPVSVPIAPKHKRAATAAPAPLDEPPGVRSSDHGLCTRPKASVDGPKAANSTMFVLPRITAPACFKRRTTSASTAAGELLRRTALAAVVR